MHGRTSASPARSSSHGRKRPLSSSGASPTTASATKRANSEDHMTSSDHEGSIGASRLNIDSTPRSPASPASSNREHSTGPDATLGAEANTGAPVNAPRGAEQDLPPAYDAPVRQDDDDADDAAEEDLPPAFASTSRYSGPAADQQLAMIIDMQQFQLEKDDTWYLVPRTWYRRWQTACSGIAQAKDDDDSLTPEQVGPINTTSITEADGVTLRKPLLPGVDVEVLPAPAWRYLTEWYGLVGPEFGREVVATGGHGSERIEFYPPVFRLYLLLPASSSTNGNVSVPSLESAPTVQLASSATLGELFDQVKTAFSLSRAVRLWRLPPVADETSALDGPAFVFADKLRESGVELLELDKLGADATLSDAMLEDEETRLAVEEQDAATNWIVDADDVLSVLAEADAVVPPEVTAASDSAVPSLTTSVASLTDAEDPHGKKHHHHHHHKNIFSSAHSWAAGLHKSKSSHAATSTATASTSTAAPAGPLSPSSKGLNGASGGGGMMGALTGALTRSKTAIGGRQGQRGLVGLQNLGNTCFMNSALQCMSNTKELQEYFLSGVYRSELNPDNPLGMRGQVAEAFGQLIERLWHGTGSSVAPREFKQALSRFAPQFSGYGQQDSQELLAFLLDGIHEDLNRIKKKPATEAPDWEGGTDKELVELAKTCWEQYRSRNDSVIVDLFQGQYRSTVVCPDCDKVSITFDPFMYVTTNLPVTKKWSGKVFVVPLEASRGIIEVELEVAKNGTIKTLKSAVGKLLDIQPKHLILTEEWKGKFYRDWHDDEMVTEIGENDRIILYETTIPYPQPRRFGLRPAPSSVAVDSSSPVIVPVAHKKLSTGGASTRKFGISEDAETFGSPFVITLSAEEAANAADVKRALARQYARVTKRGDELLQVIEEEIEALDRERAEAPSGKPASKASGDAVAPELFSPTRELMDVDGAAPADVADGSVLAPPVPLSTDVGDESTLSSSTASLGPVASTSSTTLASSTETSSSSAAPSVQSRRVAFRVRISRDPVSEGRVPLGQERSFYNGDGAIDLDELEAGGLSAPKPSASAAEDIDMFGPGSSAPIGTPEASKLEADAEGQPEATPQETVTGTRRPLFTTGHTLSVIWDANAFEYFFSPDAATWSLTQNVVDPALVAKRQQGKGAKRTITLADCLTEFTKEERLGEDDMWYCSQCKEHKQATKKVELWKVPDVLVFALKRFSSSRYSRDKIDDLVDFPVLEALDMEPFVEGDRVEKRLAEHMTDAPHISEPDSLTYELYAVSNHFGGLGGGHYTAFAKNPENGRWYDFDDSRVTEINPERVKSPAAYLLFYRRRTARPIGGAKSRELVESANASRNVSVAGSEIGDPSPYASRENLLLSTSTDDFFGSGVLTVNSDDEVPVPGRFTGMTHAAAPSPLSNLELSSASASTLPSPPGSAEPGSPKDLTTFDDAEWIAAPPAVEPLDGDNLFAQGMHSPTDASGDTPAANSRLAASGGLPPQLQASSPSRLSAETSTAHDDTDAATLAGEHGAEDLAESHPVNPARAQSEKAAGRRDEGDVVVKGTRGEFSSTGSAWPPVQRSTTTATATPPRYTIHSQRMRWFIVALVSFAGLMSPLTANIFFPVIPSIAEDLGVTVELINISVLAYMIAQGVSPSFFGAICDVLGRRPTYIVSFIIYIGACAGLANTHKYWLLVVLRIIQAAGSSSVIAIGAGSIGDIAPPAERGLFMSIFGLGPMVGPCVGPIVGGVLAATYGWQSLFWFLFVLGSLVLLSLALFLPETLRSMVGDGSIPARGINRSLVSIWHQRQRKRRMSKEAIAEADAASLMAKPPKKGWKDVKPFAPLKMFREKDVFLVLTFNSACYTLFYTVTTSTGTTFKDTYHLNETELGLCFIANGAGCLLATFINGPRMTHDYNVVKRQVERRRAEAGFSKEDEARERKKDLNDLSTFPIEHARLRSEPYFFFILIASTITYGWVLDKGVHLSVPLIMQFFIGVSVTTIFNCTSTLLVDLYPSQSASATAANNLYRCCAGAAGTGFIEPLLNRLGAGWSFTLLSLSCCCFSPLVALEWKYGMHWRAERAERLRQEATRHELKALEKGRELERTRREGEKPAA